MYYIIKYTKFTINIYQLLCLYVEKNCKLNFLNSLKFKKQ